MPVRGRAPNPSKGEDYVASVGVKVRSQGVDCIRHRPDQVARRHWVKDLCRRRSKYGRIPEYDHCDQRRQIGILHRRRSLENSLLKFAAQPVSILKVEARRIMPGFNLALNHDRQLDTSPLFPRNRFPRNGEQAIDEPLLILAASFAVWTRQVRPSRLSAEGRPARPIQTGTPRWHPCGGPRARG